MRPVWVACGAVSLACGAVGTVLPLVPTTPFILLSAYAFARSSPRLHSWLIRHPHFGPLIENWHLHGAIDRRTKIASASVMAATPVVSWMLGVSATVLCVQIIVLLAAAAFVLTRPEGPSKQKGARDG